MRILMGKDVTVLFLFIFSGMLEIWTFIEQSHLIKGC